jgi:hypothetical protein
MYTWAVLAAKESAIASGLAAGIVPVVGAGSLDGLAIGALVSGTCILMLTSPRRGRRRSLASASDSRALASASGGRALAAARGKDQEEAGNQPDVAEPAPPQDETGSATGERQDLSGGGGYQSRHRLSDQNENAKRQGTGRSTPRHAAPSASFSAKMTSRIAVGALAGAVRG